jgi:hypothetical protein
MIKEIFYCLTLQSKSRKRLRECADILSSRLDPITNSEIEQFISSNEIVAAVDVLVKYGNSHNISDKQYWSNLHIVANDHKMGDKIMYLEGKARNDTGN